MLRTLISPDVVGGDVHRQYGVRYINSERLTRSLAEYSYSDSASADAVVKSVFSSLMHMITLLGTLLGGRTFKRSSDNGHVEALKLAVSLHG